MTMEVSWRLSRISNEEHDSRRDILVGTICPKGQESFAVRHVLLVISIYRILYPF